MKVHFIILEAAKGRSLWPWTMKNISSWTIETPGSWISRNTLSLGLCPVFSVVVCPSCVQALLFSVEVACCFTHVESNRILLPVVPLWHLRPRLKYGEGWKETRRYAGYGFGKCPGVRCRNGYDNRGTEGRVIRSDGRYASKHRCECERKRGFPYVSWVPWTG